MTSELIIALFALKKTLCGRRRHIRIDESYSEGHSLVLASHKVVCCVLMLFSVFINTICFKISSLYHLYSDDFSLQIYTQGTLTELHNTIEKINSGLKQISAWRNYAYCVYWDVYFVILFLCIYFFLYLFYNSYSWYILLQHVMN